MARQPMCRRLLFSLVLIILAALLPTWSFRIRQSDIDSPPIEPAESHLNHMRARRSAADEGETDRLGKTVEDPSQVAAGYLLADSTDKRLLNMFDPLDINISMVLDRMGPDMRPSRNYHDFKDISMDMSKRSWQLMREHALVALRDRIDLAWPTFDRLLKEAQTSDKCVTAIKTTLAGAKRMESWAIKLLNSWGSFPMGGIFEGTYGDLGAYHTCVGIERNKHIDHAHYCTVSFRPVMKSSKEYELVVRKEPDELLRLFEDNRGDPQPGNHQPQESLLHDAMTDLLVHAQYHHYVYLKLGTCWPIGCNPFDIKHLAKRVGRKNILMTGPVKCFSKNVTDYKQMYEDVEDMITVQNETASRSPSKVARKKKLVMSTWNKNEGIFIWTPRVSQIQRIANGILIALSVFIFSMTLIDFAWNKLPTLCRKLALALRGLPLSDRREGNQNRIRLPVCSSMTTCAPNQFAIRPETETGALDRVRQSSGAAFQMLPSDSAAVCLNNALVDNHDNDEPDENRSPPAEPQGLFMSLVSDCSALNNVRQFFYVSENQTKNDIGCLHGIRCLTMFWILITHTMTFNDWSAWSRTREVEKALKSLILQPLFNGSYLVDTFFLMSGLLSALTVFRHCQGKASRFNSLAFIVGRWLRLTPQIFITCMAYIALPSWSAGGPHWYPIVGEHSENCIKNWWLNVLHVQSFYKKDEMCNYVTWWISIDFSYHFMALLVIWAILFGGHKRGLWCAIALMGGQMAWQSKRHYELGLPPNVLSTIPTTGSMWTTMMLEFYWTPYAHSVPFFFGLYLGYLLALKTKLLRRALNTRRALIGWTVAVLSMLTQQYSTHWWVVGEARYSRLGSTLFFGACSLAWNGAHCWIIIACQHGYGGFLNRFLSSRVFRILGKATYMIYLTHLQVLFMFFANQSLLMEPSVINMIYIIMGNIFISTAWAAILCSVYEIPWLRMHRRLMKLV